MGAPRRLGERLLRAVLRLAPEESLDWATAMLRELDFVDGDWAALFWALGSAAALLRHAAAVWQACLKRKISEEGGMNKGGRRVMGVSLGVLSALMLVACGFAGLRLLALLFPGLGLDHSRWAYWMAVLALPEAIFVVATVMLWKKKGPVAAGILATGLGMGMHVAVHMAMHVTR